MIVLVMKYKGKGLEVEPTEPKEFKQWEVKEKQIEDLVRRNPEVVYEEGENLLIVGQQVLAYGADKCDLAAVDGQGSLVLIEVKRDLSDVKNRKEGVELQAIRYVSAYAGIRTPEELVQRMYAKYVENHPGEFPDGGRTPAERALERLSEFLEENKATATFNHRQRIVLVSAGFDAQTLSSAAWLIANGVDISCYQMELTPIPAPVPKRLNVLPVQHVLDIKRLLPCGRLEDYYMEIKSSKTGGPPLPPALPPEGGGLPRVPKMFEWGLLRPGDKLEILRHPKSEAIAVDGEHVEFNGQRMSYNDWGKRVTRWSAIRIYDWAVDTKTGKTLGQLRAEKMQQLVEEGN